MYSFNKTQSETGTLRRIIAVHQNFSPLVSMVFLYLWGGDLKERGPLKIIALKGGAYCMQMEHHKRRGNLQL